MRNDYFGENGVYKACPNDDNGLIVWSQQLYKPILNNTIFGNIMSESDLNGIVRVERKLERQEGSGVKIQMAIPLSADGVIGCNTLTGREECPPTQDMMIEIDRIRHATCMTRCGCWGEQQGLYIRSRSEAMEYLKEWLAHKILSPSFIHQVTGYTGNVFVDYLNNRTAMKPQYRGFNEIHAPTNHFRISPIDEQGFTKKLVPIAGKTDEESKIDEKCRMSVSILKQISALIGNNCYGRIRPLHNRYGKYVLFLHPSQIADLKSDPTWIQAMATADVRGSNNKLFTGALGLFDGIIIRSSCEIPNGLYPNNDPISTVRRAVLLGADAATLVIGGFCKRNKQGELQKIPFRINEQSSDYNDKTNLSISAIFGIAKNRFQGKDMSSVVISTYADNFTFDDETIKVTDNYSPYAPYSVKDEWESGNKTSSKKAGK